MSVLDYVLMFIFLGSICAVGGLFARREKTTNDYLLGDSKIPWWASAISYVMALLSTVSLVAVPGEAYNNGLRLYIMEWFAPVTGLLFFFIFMRFYFNAKTFTPFTYLERRFSPSIRAVISGIYFFTRISMLAMVLLSCSLVFKGIVGWQPWKVILVLGAIATVYCTLGGLKAVIWTNFIQFFVLGGGVLITVIVCINNIDGGIAEVFRYSFANDHGFNFSSTEADFFSFDPHVRLTIWLLIISSVNAYMFYNSSDQIAIQQLLSTNSYKSAKQSFITSIIIFVPLGAILWFIGLAVFTYYAQNPLPEGNPAGDIALFTFIKQKMPSPLPGLITSAMLAAAISTIGAMMMSLSTVATKDFYFRFFNAAATEKNQVKFSRIMTVILGISCTIMGILLSISSSALGETLIETSSIWIGIMCVVPSVFFIGVINPRCNALHAWISIAIGWIATIIMIAWYIYGKHSGNQISYMAIQVPGFLLTILVGMTLPFLFGKRSNPEKIANLTLWTLQKNAEKPAPEDDEKTE